MVNVAAQDLDSITEAVLVASRALVAVAARSLASTTDDVTLPQFRALVILDVRGTQTAGELADALAIHRSTVTRLVDRLHAKKLVQRRAASGDRREVEVSLRPDGHRIVAAVTAARRREIARIVARMPAARRGEVVEALQVFAAAAGEAPEQAWSLGWRV